MNKNLYELKTRTEDLFKEKKIIYRKIANLNPSFDAIIFSLLKELSEKIYNLMQRKESYGENISEEIEKINDLINTLNRLIKNLLLFYLEYSEILEKNISEIQMKKNLPKINSLKNKKLFSFNLTKKSHKK